MPGTLPHTVRPWRRLGTAFPRPEPATVTACFQKDISQSLGFFPHMGYYFPSPRPGI